MKLINKTIQELFAENKKLTFLVGAGCSVDSPSCLPAGREMMEAIINYTCAESEIKKILNLDQLRFEQVVEIVRDILDKDLKIIDYYGLCNSPNYQHFFLADMIKKGHFVMTTNFDFLIEYALQQSEVPNDDIKPVITENDFKQFSNPINLYKERKKTVYKIHGSTKNIITKENTKKSLVATLQAFGSAKEGENVFQVEPFKRPLFDNISNGRTLIVMGYSGSDDFDIVPTLMVLKNLKNIIWINHIQDDGGIEKIYEIDDSTIKESEKFDKINKILTDIYRMHNAENIYRVDTNTTRLIKKSFEIKLNNDIKTFSINLLSWFENEINSPNEFDKYIIPYKIYNDLSQYDDAMKCSQIILKIAKHKKDDRWKSTALNNIGLLLYNKGQLDEALKYYREALEIAEQLGDLRRKATDPNNIGQLLDGKGQLDEALKYYREALEIAEQLGDLRGKATDLNNIGSLLQDKGQLDEALKYYREALEIAEQLGDLRHKATDLNNIGALLYGKGQLDEALKYYREKVSLLKKLEVIEIRNNLIGKLPDSIGQLKLFRWLDIRNNQIKELPESMGDLSSLETLRLGENKLSILPKSFGKIQSLKSLSIGSNNFTEIPEAIFDLQKLKEIFLSKNLISNIPERVENLKELEELFLIDNKIQYIPLNLCKVVKLKELLLSYNKLDDLTEAIGELINLEVLRVDNNNLKTLPESIKYLKKLLTIDIHNNPLESILFSLKELKNLKFISLSKNQIDLIDGLDDFKIGKEKDSRIICSRIKPKIT